MNSIFGRFIESCILRVSGKGFTITLQETRSIHDYLNLTKVEYIYYALHIFAFCIIKIIKYNNNLHNKMKLIKSPKNKYYIYMNMEIIQKLNS